MKGSIESKNSATLFPLEALDESFQNFDIQNMSKESKSSFRQVFFSIDYQPGSVLVGQYALLVVTVGTGFLLISDSMNQSGYVWGILQLTFCAVLDYYSLIIVMQCKLMGNVSSFQELALLTYGPKFRHLVNTVQFLGVIGSAAIYFMVALSLLETFLANIGNVPEWLVFKIGNGQILTILISIAIVLPLSLLRNLSHFRYVWFFYFSIVICVAVIIIVQSSIYIPEGKQLSDIDAFRFQGFSTTFSSALFAYTSHYNVLDVFGELKRPTKRNMKKIVKTTVFIAFVFYILIGVIGYFTFAGNPAFQDSSYQIILLKYDFNAYGISQPYPQMINACIFLIGILILVRSPVYIKPAKDCLTDFFYPTRTDPNGDPLPIDPSHHHFIFVFSTIVVSMVLAILFNVQNAFAFIMSTFYVLTCFVFPTIIYMKLAKNAEKDPDVASKPKRKHKTAAWIILVSMSIFGVWVFCARIITVIDPNADLM